MLKVGGGEKGVALEFSLGRGRRRSKRSSKELRRKAQPAISHTAEKKKVFCVSIHRKTRLWQIWIIRPTYELTRDISRKEKENILKFPNCGKRDLNAIFKKMQKEEKTPPSRSKTKKQLDFRFFQGCNKDLTRQAKKNFFLLFLVCGRWKESDAEQIGFCSGKKKRNEFVQRHLGLLHFSKRRREGEGGEKNSINPPYLYLAKKSYLRD